MLITAPEALTVVQADHRLTHIALRGSLDADVVNRIEDRLAAVVGARRKPTIVDFGAVEFIASRGIGMLVANARNLARHGRKMVLLNTPARFRSMFCTIGLDRIIPFTDDFTQALELLA